MSLNVSLPIELENRVREALRLFESYQAAQTASLNALKTDIAQGMADVQASRVAPLNIKGIKARGRHTIKTHTSS